MHGLTNSLIFTLVHMGTEHTELTNSDMSSGFTNEDVTEDMARVLKTIQEMSLSCIEKPVS